MNDQTWVTIRYILIGIGGFFAGKGILTPEQVVTLVDQFINLVPAVVAFATAIWGLYVRWGTKGVPAVTAARDDVPTINPATGAHIAGKDTTT